MEEVQFFTRLAVEEDGQLKFADVALVRSFLPPDKAALRRSQKTLITSQLTDTILVVNTQDILSVVAMIPHTYDMAECFFCVKQPGLTQFMGAEAKGDGNDEDYGGEDSKIE